MNDGILLQNRVVLFQRLDVPNHGQEIQSDGFTDGLQLGVADLTLKEHLQENQGEMLWIPTCLVNSPLVNSPLVDAILRSFDHANAVKNELE